MFFIEKIDLETVASLELIDMLTDNNDQLLDKIIEENIAFVASYLEVRYNTTTIFGATGLAREALVLKIVKDIVIYHVYIRHTRQQENEVALKRYEAAITWLEQVAQGDLSPDLPLAAT